MAYPHLIPTVTSSSTYLCCFPCPNFNNRDDGVNFRSGDRKQEAMCSARIGVSVCRVLRGRDFTVRQWRVDATTDTRVVENVPARTSTVEIPVSCYQLIGVPDIAEKDEIVKSVMQLKRAEIEEGYSMDTVISRQDLLMDVRDKLLFEPKYAGNVRDKIPPKCSIRIPWAWLPGALSLLQEVGEAKLVQEISRVALQHPEAKPYIHDILLSMALAECAIAKASFEKNKVSYGFESLARAQCLLRSKASLGNMTLLSQIEESLEELAPACTLELLSMQGSPENAERRQGALAALRELLKQGLDVEASCRVQDWPCFLSQALNGLMAIEIVDLLPWDDLSVTRKNKKSIESQNQRVVIDFNCFYVVLIAHIALGFSRKRRELIKKATIICECLMASDGADIKFEEDFCLFLLGECNEAQAAEKLHQRELNSNAATRNLYSKKEVKDSGKEIKDAYGVQVQPSLEIWLKDAVLAGFSDTQDCSPSLVKFFIAEKKAPENKKDKGAQQRMPTVGHRALSAAIAMEPRDRGESLRMNSSEHLGSAVKQLAPTDLQTSLILGKNDSASNASEPSTQLKRNLGVHHTKFWEHWLVQNDVVRRIPFVVVVGCIVFITFKLSGMKVGFMGSKSKWSFSKSNTGASSFYRSIDSSCDYNVGPAYIRRNGITGIMKELLAMVKMHSRNRSVVKNPDIPCVAASLSSSETTVLRKQMPIEEAEALVKQWQAIKADALGRNHQIDNLSTVLDESMLVQWQALAEAAFAKSCYWRFVLLQLSVLKAEILLDGFGMEMAEVDAFLVEAAELVDESQSKKPNYYSTYRIRYVLKRQDDGSWRFCKGDILAPS
ncbi:plastid division protein CDP1 chloroplastic-like isoform X1 [Tripterygium wilfordii]|uniref:Plastid division protein CDP1 chloroplastic-like isoform X1 n=1 Tax=Tripterygium wilfordii TaxID=458696 RepID=A0A7J7CIV0_TRIWF|nr:plastid division protein CDP1, chloroplastic [Tripterygium wilfordii]KAF5733969.1 plastid division protein CDP1 chloroplastic-like isoform X1 [Tripterygium wilfordii]